MKKLLLLLPASLLVNFAFGQNLPDLNEDDLKDLVPLIQNQIKSYEINLNQLIAPYSNDRQSDYIIKNSYSNTSNNQIFYDENVVIQDDRVTGAPINTPVERYLYNFRLFYRDTISRVEIVDIQLQDTYTQDKEYILTFTFKVNFFKATELFKTYSRLATFTATYTGEWKVLIKSIVYDKNKISEPPPVVRKPPARIPFVFIDSLDIDEFFILTPVALTVRPIPFSLAEFRPLPDAMKWKKTYPISWENATRPHTLWLYRDETLQQTLAQSTAGNALNWKVPKKINDQKLQLGQGYHFRLYNPNTKLTAMSGNFSIKRKLPLGLQIPIYIGIAGGIGYAVYRILNPPCNDCLPGPEELNPYTQ